MNSVSVIVLSTVNAGRGTREQWWFLVEIRSISQRGSGGGVSFRVPGEPLKEGDGDPSQGLAIRLIINI